MTGTDGIDLDKIVDYTAEYTSVIEKYKITGEQLTGLCPFHDDRNSSFSADLKTGKWYCFTEGEGGNFVSFWARLNGTDSKTAYREILEKYGVSCGKPEPAKRSLPIGGAASPYTLEQYSADKRLPLDFLRDTCRLSTEKDRDGIPYLKIPYLGTNGQVVLSRKRYGKKDFRWGYGSKGKIFPYGVWRLPEFQKTGYCVLVEGESDTQSLWQMGIPAIGIPGATLFKTDQTEYFKGLRLYIHQEPDAGGQTFTDKLFRCLHDGGFTGEVYRWDCKALGEKDPSDIYIKNGRDNGAKLIRQALDGAERISLDEYVLPEAIAGAPITLRQPEGFIYSDKGISLIDQKTLRPVTICRTPILLTKRIRSMDSGEEKIEISFLRDGRWRTSMWPRSTIFSSRKITDLSDLGCTITSENAKMVVKFLGALEGENLDKIPSAQATSILGWKPGCKFMPGHDDGLVLDCDSSMQTVASAYRQSGTMEGWISAMRPHRERNRFRFILAAAFAAPLLKLTRQRNFLIYNWGGSRGGKTAALLAGMSAWGEPEKLMISFDTTVVGLEHRAGLCCDLPMGIDERQQAGNRQEFLERLVYMLANGTGRVRGTRSGGLQPVYQWRTVALSTGEEPLTVETSKGGVATRALQIYGPPFEDEDSAGAMYGQTAEHYGHAGLAFIKRLVEMKQEDVQELCHSMRDYVKSLSDGGNGAHTAAIALVALADAMIDTWLFEGLDGTAISPNSWERAKQMAADILVNQVESNTVDVNENATQFIVDWVLSNKAHFVLDSFDTYFGFASDDDNSVYIFPSMFNQVLTKAGFSPQKPLQYMAEKRLIKQTIEKKSNGRTIVRNTVKHRIGKKTANFVCFNIGRMSEINNEEEIPTDGSESVQYQTSTDNWIEIDDDLPFE